MIVQQKLYCILVACTYCSGYFINQWPNINRPLVLKERFDLDEYTSSTLMKPFGDADVLLAATPLHVSEAGDSAIDILSSLESDADNIILVDLTVREFQDLSSLNDDQVFKVFEAKLKYQNSLLSADKFLYTHDIGRDTVQKVSIARIPIEMYQKLDLARRLLEAHASCISPPVRADGKKKRKLHVHMLSQQGEVIADVDMMDALCSAFHAYSFQLPNMKKENAKETKTSSDEESTNTFFSFSIAIPHSLTTPTGTKTGTTGSGARGEGKTEQLDASSKISALEASMLAASEANYGVKSDISSASLDDDNGVDRAVAASPRQGWSKVISNQAVALTYESIHSRLRTSKYFTGGTNLARALASLPPNVLDPASYMSLIKRLAEEYQWEVTEWTPKELEAAGCGAFCAVTQANQKGDTPSADRLVKLTSRVIDSSDGRIFSDSADPLSFERDSGGCGRGPPSMGVRALSKKSRLSRGPIVLVGKGVTYDTGGINLKSAGSMRTMKHDMAGSAVALGSLLALTLQQREESPVRLSSDVECWLAIAENNINERAYRPDDVIYAATKDSIEIVDSDAEGRLLLADTLALASRKVPLPSTSSASAALFDDSRPSLVIDYATLTGSCISSLSNRYIGGFSNRENLLPLLMDAGKKSGERLWPFPLDDDFSDDLKSDLANLLQCKQDGAADHIYAATFLKRFVSDHVPWIHLDLSSAFRSGGLGHVGSDYTGSGVRLTQFLIQEMIR